MTQTILITGASDGIGLEIARQAIAVGPIAAVIMATAPVMPQALDLAFMSLLFKGRRNMVKPNHA